MNTKIPSSVFDKIKLISLDIWGTLILSNPEFKTHQLTLFTDYLNINDSEKLKNIVKQVDQIADRLSLITEKDIDFDKRIQKISQKTGNKSILSEEKLHELYSKMEVIFLENLPLFIENDLPETLEEIRKKGLQICLLSNTGFIKGSTMKLALKKLGIYSLIDFSVFSNETGYAKPSPFIFRELSLKTNLEPNEILHIGDNYDADYTGAKKVKFRALHFNKDIEKFNNFVYTTSIHRISSLLNFFE